MYLELFNQKLEILDKITIIDDITNPWFFVNILKNYFLLKNTCMCFNNRDILAIKTYLTDSYVISNEINYYYYTQSKVLFDILYHMNVYVYLSSYELIGR